MLGSQALVVATLGSAFMVGVILPLLRRLEPALAVRLGLREPRVGGLHVTFLLTLIVGLPVAGLVVDRWGTQEGLILGYLAAALGLACLGQCHSRITALAWTALIGAALALAHTATAVLMTPTLAEGRPTMAINLGYAVVGAGSLVAAALTPLLERRVGLRQGLLVLALLCLLPAAVAGLTAGEFFPRNHTLTSAAGEGALDLKVLLAGLVLFLYLPLENSIAAWAPAYLKEVGHRERALPILFSGFWVAFVGARIVAALLPAGFIPWLILILTILTAATIGNLVGLYGTTGGMSGFWMLGAWLGPVFPCVAAVTLGLFPQSQGLAFGSVFALGSVGALVLQPGIESVAQRGPVRSAMRLLMLTALVAAAPALVLCLLSLV